MLPNGKYYINIQDKKLVSVEDNVDYSDRVTDWLKITDLNVDWDGDFITVIGRTVQRPMTSGAIFQETFYKEA